MVVKSVQARVDLGDELPARGTTNDNAVSGETAIQTEAQTKQRVPNLVSVIVVNWNGKDLLSSSLGSLEKQRYPSLEIVVVDNASTDGSVEYVRTTFPSVKIVCADANLGYAGGCNLGVRHARGDYLLLLNNDTQLAPDVVGRLAEDLNRCSRLGAVSAFAVSGLGEVTPSHPRTSTINILGKHMTTRGHSTTGFYAPGACCMYRRVTLREPYDSEYFAYDEDVYLSWLLRLLGLDVAVDCDAHFEHNVSSTSRRIRDYVVFCAERNRWMNLLIFYEVRTLAKLAPLVAANVTAKVLTSVEGIKPKILAYIWLARNFRSVLAKRGLVQRQRAISDEALTRHMEGDLTDSEGRLSLLANVLARAYLRWMGIQTQDSPPIAREREE